MAEDKAITDGINADEDERCQHLAELAKKAKELGLTVSSGVDIPDLNPDGSYADGTDIPAE